MNPSPQAHLILLLVIVSPLNFLLVAAPLNLFLTLRLYDSLAWYLIIVPYPIVIKYSTAQTLLIIRPIGKPSVWVPGRMDSLTFIAVFD